MPRPVVPIFLRPLFSSRPRSIRLWYGKMTWAFSLTTSCCGSTKRPRLVRKLAQLLEDLGARPPIHVDEGQRLSIRSVAGEGELSDVHLRLAQRVSDVADDAGLVLVGHDQHRPGRRRLDREAVHPHDARLALADDGAGHLGR